MNFEIKSQGTENIFSELELNYTVSQKKFPRLCNFVKS